MSHLVDDRVDTHVALNSILYRAQISDIEKQMDLYSGKEIRKNNGNK